MTKYTLTILAVFLLSGCVSSRMADREPDRLFREGRYDEAAAKLQTGLEEEGDGSDQLLYLMDLGLVLHTAGRYEESNKAFLKADDIAEIKDYTSLAAETGTLLVSDNIKQYKGEDFEKVLINVYLAINYALLGDYESALVETKKSNRKLQRMISEGERKYKLNAFAFYLSGICYEAMGEFGEAYIDYKKANELVGNYPSIGKDLFRTAKLSRRFEDLKKWEKEFKLSSSDQEEAMAIAPKGKKADFIVIYENGFSPIKRPHPNWHSIPKFFPRPNPVDLAVIKANDERLGRTRPLHNIELTAIENLDEKYAGIIAKKIAGVVAKEAVGEVVASQTKSEGLGFLTKLVLHAADQADLRSWNLLPKDLQVARFAMQPGDYRIDVEPQGASDRHVEKKVSLTTRKKTLLSVRYVP